MSERMKSICSRPCLEPGSRRFRSRNGYKNRQLCKELTKNYSRILSVNDTTVCILGSTPTDMT